MRDLSGYQQWLVDEGYQPGTIAATLRHIRVVAAAPDNDVAYRAPHVRRYLLYVKTTKRHPLSRQFADKMKASHGLQAVATGGSRGTKGKRAKRLLDGGQRYTLHQTLRKGDPVDKLLVAYMESPLQINAFLKMRLCDVNDETVCHGWSRKWMGGVLPSSRGKRVYEILATTAERAYTRLRRRLIAVSAELGFAADFAMLRKSFHERQATRQAA